MQAREQTKKANKGAEEMNGLLTTKEAAALIGLAPHTLEMYRWRGTGPKFIKGPGKPGVNRGPMSGLVHYRVKDLLTWRDESVICVICDRRVLGAIEVEGTLWCNDCFERVKPVTVKDQARWERRKLRSKRAS